MQVQDTTSNLLAIGWLVSFFGFGIWYSWQMKVHGWRLPKHIKDTLIYNKGEINYEHKSFIRHFYRRDAENKIMDVILKFG